MQRDRVVNKEKGNKVKEAAQPNPRLFSSGVWSRYPTAMCYRERKGAWRWKAAESCIARNNENKPEIHEHGRGKPPPKKGEGSRGADIFRWCGVDM